MIVPTIEKALFKRMPNILLHVDPIICVSFPVILAIPCMIVVIIPTLIITNKATLTIVPISSVCDFFCIILLNLKLVHHRKHPINNQPNNG